MVGTVASDGIVLISCPTLCLITAVDLIAGIHPAILGYLPTQFYARRCLLLATASPGVLIMDTHLDLPQQLAYFLEELLMAKQEHDQVPEGIEMPPQDVQRILESYDYALKGLQLLVADTVADNTYVVGLLAKNTVFCECLSVVLQASTATEYNVRNFRFVRNLASYIGHVCAFLRYPAICCAVFLDCELDVQRGLASILTSFSEHPHAGTSGCH